MHPYKTKAFGGRATASKRYADGGVAEHAYQRGIRKTDWYKEFEAAEGNPKLNDPDYDYRAAWKAGSRPETRDAGDGRLHWSSKFKGDNHPNRYVDGVDTKAD